MKGTNTLQLNKATVMAALQMYMDAQLKDEAHVLVSDVKALSGSGTYEPVFEVTVEEDPIKVKVTGSFVDDSGAIVDG